MKRVVVAGRWDGGAPALPTGEALDAIRRGVLAGASEPTVLTVPFGTGPTSDEAVASLRSQASVRDSCRAFVTGESMSAW